MFQNWKPVKPYEQRLAEIEAEQDREHKRLADARRKLHLRKAAVIERPDHWGTVKPVINLGGDR